MLRICSIAVFILIFAVSCHTAEQSYSVELSIDEVTAKLVQDYPKIEPLQLSPAPVAGLYEIILVNEDLLYYAPESGLLVVGDLWTPDARNLTDERKNERMSAKVSLFPLDQAIKIGDGPKVVIEVTDPDCPYCRKGSEFFDERDDVTRYVYLYPLTRLHPEAEAKARYILSSEDPVAAYEDVFSGLYDGEDLPEFEDNGMLEKHNAIIKEVGVTGTPKYWVDGKHISGFNQANFEKVLTP